MIIKIDTKNLVEDVERNLNTKEQLKRFDKTIEVAMF
jgi:hypothetical protein